LAVSANCRHPCFELQRQDNAVCGRWRPRSRLTAQDAKRTSGERGISLRDWRHRSPSAPEQRRQLARALQRGERHPPRRCLSRLPHPLPLLRRRWSVRAARGCHRYPEAVRVRAAGTRTPEAVAAIAEQCASQRCAGLPAAGASTAMMSVRCRPGRTAASLDAAVCVAARGRASPGCLLRCCARPPFALDRLNPLDAESVVRRLPKPQRDGTAVLACRGRFAASTLPALRRAIKGPCDQRGRSSRCRRVAPTAGPALRRLTSAIPDTVQSVARVGDPRLREPCAARDPDDLGLPERGGPIRR
jgi:hypothetical protein